MSGWKGYFDSPGSQAPVEGEKSKASGGGWSGYFDNAPPAPAAPASTQAPISVSAPSDFNPGPLRIPLMLGSEALQGAAGDLDTLRTGLAPLVPQIPAGRVALPGEVLRASPGTIPSGDLVGALRSLGLVENPALAPQTPNEGLAAGAARGVGSAVPMLAIGGGLVPTLMSGAAGGAAGKYMEGTGLEVPAGMLAGGIAGVPLARGPQTLENIARTIGSHSETLEQAGAYGQAEVRDWLRGTFGTPVGGGPNRIEALFDPINTVMSQGGQTGPATELSNALAAIRSRGGRLTSSVQHGSSDFIDTVQNDVNNIGGQMTWDEARALRTKIGDMMSNPKLDHGANQSDLDFMYRALSRDMENATDTAGVGDQFRAANAEAYRLYLLRKNVMSRIVKGDNPAGEVGDPLPGNVAANLLGTGKNQGQLLAQLRGELPHVGDEMTRAMLLERPQVWSRLGDAAKEQIVPDPATRAAIDAALPGPTASTASRRLNQLVAGIIGRAIGAVTGEAMGHMPVVGEAVGEAAGALAPPAANWLRTLFGAPRKLTQPLVGGVAGGSQGSGQ